MSELQDLAIDCNDALLRAFLFPSLLEATVGGDVSASVLLRSAPKLDVLRLNGTFRLPERDLVQEAPKLTELVFSGARWDDSQTIAIVRLFPNLTELSLRHSSISSLFLHWLPTASLSRLVCLRLDTTAALSGLCVLALRALGLICWFCSRVDCRVRG